MTEQRNPAVLMIATTTETSIPTDKFTLSLYGIEMTLCSLAIPVLCIFTGLLMRTSIIDKNLRILLLGQTVAFMLMAITRFAVDCNVIVNVIAINSKQNEGPVLQNFLLCKSATYVYDTAVLAAVTIFMLSAVERTIASKRVHVYENAKPRLAYGLVTATWSLAVFMTTYSLFDESKGKEWQEHFFTGNGQALTCAQTLLSPHPLLLTAFAVIGLNLVSLGLFIFVLSVNKRRYAAILNRAGTHSLSERFQILEIIKSMMLLAPSITVLFIEYALMSGLIGYIYYSLEGKTASDADIVRLWNFEQLYTLCGVMYALAEPLVRLISHAGLRMRAKQLFFGGLLPAPEIPISPGGAAAAVGAVALRNIAGRQMNVAPGNQQQQIYFENYEQAWGTTSNARRTR